MGTVYRESLTRGRGGGLGVTAKNFERIAKNREFLHLYMQKRALCLCWGVKGQGRTYTLYAIVLWFQSRFKRSEIRFRSGVISSELYAAITIFQFLAPKNYSGA